MTDQLADVPRRSVDRDHPSRAARPEARIVDELRKAVARRRSAEIEIDELEARGFDFADHAAEESLEEQVAALELEIDDRERHFFASREQFAAEHAAETDEAEREFRRATQEIERAAQERIDAVEAQYEENEWMLGSLLADDSEGSPVRQYETLKTQLHAARDELAERWETLREKYAAGVAIAETRGMGVGELLPAQVELHSRRDAMVAFETGEGRVLAGAARLERQVFARAMTPLLLGIIFFAITGGVFAVMRFGISPEMFGLGNLPPRMWLMICAGAGLAAALMTVIILHGIARKQTRDGLVPLQAGMAEAHAGHGRWLGFAKEELAQYEKEYRNRQHDLADRRDEAARQFNRERDSQLSGIEAERARGLVEPTRRRDERLREAQRRLVASQRQLDGEHSGSVAALRKEIAARKTRLEQDRQQRKAARQSDHARRLQAMINDWAGAIGRLEEMITASRSADARVPVSWDAILDAAWGPPEDIPDGIRFGENMLSLSKLEHGLPTHAALEGTPSEFGWPARLPFPGNPSLCLKVPLEGRGVALEILQVAMLRLLSALPPGTVRFTVLDPVGLGESFSAFMHLADYDELLISSRIWTEPSQIDEQLAKLTDHMESVFQKYLRGEYDSIEDYNQEAGEVAEPYRILVVAGFPNGFSDRAAARLGSILASGPRCGVFPLIATDMTQPTPGQFDPARLDDAGTVLHWRGGRFVHDQTHELLTLTPDAPPAAADFAAIVRKIGELSRHVRRVEVSFRRIIPPESEYWSGDSRRSIDCPLGRAGARRLQNFHLGTGTSQHVLVAGKTGSGKSTLLHVLITNLALRYAPDELNFYLIDFKKGVEFKTYATGRLPHARVIAIESDREFAVSVLERLGEILKSRGDRFRAAGVQDIAAFRQECPDEPMPRIVLIVDEFQEFFTEDDRHAQSAALLLDRLVRQGRAFGMHVLLGSQTLGGAYSLARATIGQMAVRIALQCSESDAHLILSEDNTAARLLTRPGEAIYNDANGMLEGNSPFQIAWLSDSQQTDALAEVASLATARRIAIEPPIVFEGNVPADPASNEELSRRIQEARSRESVPPPVAWIGESVAITGPTAIRFAPHAGANVLLAGTDEAAAAGIMTAMLVSLSAGLPEVGQDPAAGGATFHLLSGRAGQSASDEWSQLAELLGGVLEVGDASRAGEVIASLTTELESRKKAGAAALSPVLAVILAGGWIPGGGRYYWLTFFSLGMQPVTFRTLTNYTLELAQPAWHPRYLSTLKICLAVPFLLSLPIGWLVGWIGYEAVFLASSAVIAIACGLTWGLSEPRHRSRTAVGRTSAQTVPGSTRVQ